MIVDERAPTAAPAVVADAPPGAAAGARDTRSPLEVVLSIVPVVALAELLLIRTFYRVGIFIPKRGPFRTIYAVLTDAGSFAFNLSTVLVLFALAMLASLAWRRGRRPVASTLGVFLAGSLVAMLPGATGAGPAVRLVFVLAVAVVAWPFVRRPGRLTERLAVGVAAGIALLSSYAGFAGDASRLFPAADGPGGAVAAQLAGEALVVLAAFLFFAAGIRDEALGWKAVALGALPGLALLGAWWTNGVITGILVLWTAGLRLFLPVWLYALALWAFAAAALGRMGDGTRRSGGMVLLVVSGFLLESTYAQALVILALALLTDGFALGGPVRAADRAGRGR